MSVETKLKVIMEQNRLYQNAINRIDDYFEYTCESTKDQQVVYKILDELNDSLKETVTAYLTSDDD